MNSKITTQRLHRMGLLPDGGCLMMKSKYRKLKNNNNQALGKHPTMKCTTYSSCPFCMILNFRHFANKKAHILPTKVREKKHRHLIEAKVKCLCWSVPCNTWYAWKNVFSIILLLLLLLLLFLLVISCYLLFLFLPIEFTFVFCVVKLNTMTNKNCLFADRCVFHKVECTRHTATILRSETVNFFAYHLLTTAAWARWTLSMTVNWVPTHPNQSPDKFQNYE